MTASKPLESGFLKNQFLARAEKILQKDAGLALRAAQTVVEEIRLLSDHLKTQGSTLSLKVYYLNSDAGTASESPYLVDNRDISLLVIENPNRMGDDLLFSKAQQIAEILFEFERKRTQILEKNPEGDVPQFAGNFSTSSLRKLLTALAEMITDRVSYQDLYCATRQTPNHP